MLLIKWKYCFVLFLTLFPYIVNSQMIADTVKIDEITILFEKEITKAGITNYKIDSELKSQANHSSLSDLLKSTGLVFIREYGSGNLSTASIRGTGASHTQVSWNGLNINSPLTGQVDFSIIPVDFIDIISISPGNAGLQEQAGTIGGNILLKNSYSNKNGFHLKVSQEIAGFSTYNTFVKADYGYKKIQFITRLSSGYSKNNFTYLNTATLPNTETKQNNAHQRNKNLMQDIYFKINENSLIVLNLWGSKNDREIPALMSYEGVNHQEEQSDEKTMTNLKWVYLRNKIKTNIQIGHIYDKTDYILRHQSTIGMITANESRGISNSLFNKTDIIYSINESLKLDLSFDFTHHDANYENHISGSNFNAIRNEFSIYSGIHKKINKKIITYVLLRNSLIDNKLSPLAPVLGFEYILFEESDYTITGNIGTNYRFPSLNDLYFVPGGNNELRPENSKSAELGIRFKREIVNTNIDITLHSFSSLVNDWILWKPTQFAYWQPENIDRVISRGLETIIKLKTDYRSFTYIFSGNYSYTHTTNESLSDSDLEIKGHQLIFIPIHKGNIRNSIKLRNSKFNYNIHYTGLRYTNYGNSQSYNSLPAFILHDIVLKQNIKSGNNIFNISFMINNIFNKDYQNINYRATPGRNFSIKINYEF